MKIALVGPIPPPNGGMAMQTLQLRDLLEQRGHQVTLIAVNPPYWPTWIGHLPVLRALFRLIPYRQHLSKALAGHDVVHIMANSGWAWHLFAAPALRIAARCGVPAVVNYRGGLADQFLRKAVGRFKRNLQYCAALVVPSTFLQQVFARYQISSKVVPNIIDVQRFQFRPRPLQAPGPHIIVARNLEPLYGNHHALHVLARLLERHADARLSLAGDGPQRAELEVLASDLGISERVHFCGRLDREQMAELYASADILLNPTTADNMPNSLLEAMACGVPVVTTDAGGIPHLVEDGRTALMVAVEDVDAMATAVQRLLDDPELSHRLSQAGYAEVQRFTADTVVPQWEQLYHQVSGGNAHA
ncbi:glycosyltransferase family 4 protein [Motiliproteus sediminis]|uniref:glycosyltransferase family 4 protein n=1 Tax=Motiliproteus sediminis TaxID=1468178 RepID=UPI001AEF79AA|nr:glycosyltransferase family 4 protein [Motiliproteus sediminis]